MTLAWQKGTLGEQTSGEACPAIGTLAAHGPRLPAQTTANQAAAQSLQTEC